MAKIIEWQSTPTYSIPLDSAMLCVNCNTISNSLPHRCSVCGSQSILRLLTILDPEPDPPAAGRVLPSLAYTRAVSA